MGVLTGIESRPGLHFITPFGASIRRVATTNRTMDLPNLKVADKRGNPVIVSAILNYRVIDAKRAILNVANVDSYIRTNAQVILLLHLRDAAHACVPPTQAHIHAHIACKARARAVRVRAAIDVRAEESCRPFARWSAVR